MRRFRVARRPRDGFQSEFVPKDFARPLVQAKEPPLLRPLFMIGLNVSVQPELEFGFVAWLDGGGDIDAVLPHNRAGVAQAGNRRLPADIFSGFDVPGDWRGVVGNAAGLRATELWPVDG